jgi:serine protease Do
MFKALFVLLSASSLFIGCASTKAPARVAPPAAATVEAPVRTARAVAHPRRAMMKRVLSTNVRLFVFDGGEAKKSASAVVVGSEVTSTGAATYLVTNAHALDTRGMKAPELRVVVDRPWEDGGAEPMEFLGEPVAVGQVPDMDLALVRVLGIQLEAAELAADDELVPGDAVVVAAAPFGRAVSLSGGLVSHVEWDRKSGLPRLLKTDAPIGYGASGGGIYSTETGRLLAIVEGYRTAKINLAVAQENVSFDVPMPGETFAAPASKVRAFLAARGFGHLVDRTARPTRAAAIH